MLEIDPQNVSAYLNDLFQRDSKCISEIFENRVRCNESIANDDYVVVRDDDDGSTLGVLGLLNGLFEDSSFAVAARYDKDNKLIGFDVVEKSIKQGE